MQAAIGESTNYVPPVAPAFPPASSNVTMPPVIQQSSNMQPMSAAFPSMSTGVGIQGALGESPKYNSPIARFQSPRSNVYMQADNYARPNAPAFPSASNNVTMPPVIQQSSNMQPMSAAFPSMSTGVGIQGALGESPSYKSPIARFQSPISNAYMQAANYARPNAHAFPSASNNVNMPSVIRQSSNMQQISAAFPSMSNGVGIQGAVGDSPSYKSPVARGFQSPISNDLCSNGPKRMRSPCDEHLQGRLSAPVYMSDESARKKARISSEVTDYSDPFAVRNKLEELEVGEFGSVTKKFKELMDQKNRMMSLLLSKHPNIVNMESSLVKEVPAATFRASSLDLRDVIDVDADNAATNVQAPIVVLDSDDEETGDSRPSTATYQEIILPKPAGEFLMKDFLVDCSKNRTVKRENSRKGDARPVIQNDAGSAAEKDARSAVEKDARSAVKKDAGSAAEKNARSAAEKDAGSAAEKDGGSAAEKDAGSAAEKDAEPSIENKTKDKGVYVGVEDDDMEDEDGNDSDDDGLDHIWKEMSLAKEYSKDDGEDVPCDEGTREGEEDCDHSFVLKDDLGYVCRICGVVQRGIESIIEYQYAKSSRSTRTYGYERSSTKDKDSSEVFRDGVKPTGQEFTVTEVCAHPRHSKQMKPHQVEGFNFLASNLVADNPGGCIMAHAPGSGKTFMIISFMQSFMAKYPHARPLVVLPRGILGTWKREFKRWEIEDTPLFDFYSVKAENRSQQLEVLKQWVGQKSILFLGYKQFSTIVCDDDNSSTAIACQEILLTYPSILILDEGHTPRNENTDVLSSLKKVQTPRKVVLSGTLYQNHVNEVFNIFDLVRPKFLKQDTSRAIIKRILSRIPSVKKRVMTKGLDTVFYESVEHALQKDENFKRKITVIHDLREMTSKVLHFYKGDFLDELPGLLEFTVFLNLTPRQKHELGELKKLYNRKFKISSEGSALYVHPQLRDVLNTSVPVKGREGIDEAKIDQIIDNLDIREGAKAKFFLNLLGLCESGGEKLLVFSNYLLPLKFLERLAAKIRGWSLGREIFVITGDTTSEEREVSMDRFNNSPDARVFFGSIKACGEGISLVGASRVLILDVHLNPSVTRQAIGRAYRPGQEKKVYIYRLVAADSPEEEDNLTCFRKESISKMWFEWNEFCSQDEFEMEPADVNDCGDVFLESPKLSEDVKSLYKR